MYLEHYLDSKLICRAKTHLRLLRKRASRRILSRCCDVEQRTEREPLCVPQPFGGVRLCLFAGLSQRSRSLGGKCIEMATHVKFPVFSLSTQPVSIDIPGLDYGIWYEWGKKTTSSPSVCKWTGASPFCLLFVSILCQDICNPNFLCHIRHRELALRVTEKFQFDEGFRPTHRRWVVSKRGFDV